jgi:hypothetical protein
MELNYCVKNNSDLHRECKCIVFLEDWTSPSEELKQITSGTNGYVFHSTNDCIQIYKKQGLPDILGINIGSCSELISFTYFIKYGVEKAYSMYGARINIFIGGTRNSKEFSDAAALYCEQNLRYRYTLSFFCSNEAIDTLKNSFEALRTKLKSREKLIAVHMLENLKCKRCKNFSYEPMRFLCCNIVVCLSCSNISLCPKCGKSSTSKAKLNLQDLTEIAPWFCPCGYSGVWKERRLHQRTCLFPSVRCNICNLEFSCSSILPHLTETHMKDIFEADLF